MAKKYHPDSNNHNHASAAGGSAQANADGTAQATMEDETLKKERFQQIQMAYEVLSNE